MQTIGEKIRELRKSKKMSQEDLAFEIGVSRQSVHKWEGGDAYPGTDKLKLLCNYFKVSLDYFMNEITPVEEVAVADEATSVQEIAEVEGATADEEAITPVEEVAVTDNRQKQKTKKYLIVSTIVIIIISLALVGSISFTIGTGCIVFTDNLGKEYLSVLEVHRYSFYLFLLLSLILIALDVIVIIFIKREKSKV